jgi:hypothetical protein
MITTQTHQPTASQLRRTADLTYEDRNRVYLQLRGNQISYLVADRDTGEVLTRLAIPSYDSELTSSSHFYQTLAGEINSGRLTARLNRSKFLNGRRVYEWAYYKTDGHRETLIGDRYVARG